MGHAIRSVIPALLYPIARRALTGRNGRAAASARNACQIGSRTGNEEGFDDVRVGEVFLRRSSRGAPAGLPVSYAPARRTVIFRGVEAYAALPTRRRTSPWRRDPAPKRCRGIRREADAPVRSCAEREGFVPSPAASPSACLRPALGFPRNPCPQSRTAIARSSFPFDPPAFSPAAPSWSTVARHGRPRSKAELRAIERPSWPTKCSSTPHTRKKPGSWWCVVIASKNSISKAPIRNSFAAIFISPR